jgi:hypothetical protein
MVERVERLTHDERGRLDEVVIYGAATVHLERMGGRRFWLGITRPDGSQLAIWLGDKDVHYEPRDGFAIQSALSHPSSSS